MLGSPQRVPDVILVAGLLMLLGAGAEAAGLRDEAGAYRAEGYAQQQAGDWDSAYTWYRKAVALDPTYATPHNDLGVLLEHQWRLEEAEHAYRKALELKPDYAEAHENLAMLYEVLGQPELAAHHWLRRYQLGTPGDVWTQHAQRRLVARGVLRTTSVHTPDRHRDWSWLVEEELALHRKSVEAFHRITEGLGGVYRP